MPKFVKISELSGEDRGKLNGYWSELWGKEFANALTKDYKPEGKTKEVKASAKESK